MITIKLPWPPSVNHYYQRNRFGGVRVSREGKAYRENVFFEIKNQKIPSFKDALIKVRAFLYMPDKKKRDGDNVFKALFDALEYTKVFNNDCQVYDCHWTKICDESESGVTLIIEEYSKDPTREQANDESG